MRKGPIAAALLALLSAPADSRGKAAGEELLPGLVGEYYSIGGQIERFPEIGNGVKPVLRRVDRRIDFGCNDDGFAGTRLRDYFFVRWTGIIRVPRDGKYVFFTNSDDGSRLYVGDKLVVDNGGLHAMLEKAGEVELKTGDHPIRVDFFENDGGAGCMLSWDPPGGPKEVIPEGVLFHSKGLTPAEDRRRRPSPAAEEAGRNVEPAAEGGGKPPSAPAAVPGAARQPDLAGRVVGVFEDDPLALIIVKRGGSEVPVYTNKGTHVAYMGIAREGRRPTAGYYVQIWLRHDAPDTAESVRFSLERK